MSEPKGTSDDDDPAALARRFLDLWQEEIAGTGRARGPGQLALRLAALHLAALAGDGESGGLNGHAGTTEAGAEAGAEAPPAASRDGERRLAELSRRLAGFEERIAALEARPASAGGGSRTGARARRS